MHKASPIPSTRGEKRISISVLGQVSDVFKFVFHAPDSELNACVSVCVIW